MQKDILFNLSWYRLQVELLNIRRSPLLRAHPISIIEAIIKGTNFFINHQLPTVFHIKGKGLPFKIRENVTVPVEILLFQCDDSQAMQWKDGFINYMNHPETEKNFQIQSITGPFRRSLYDLCPENSRLPCNGEICLEFLTPFHFNRHKDKPRTFITKDVFINSFLKRIKRLFNIEFNYAVNDTFHLLPYYWHYAEIKHPSRSQKGHMQYINGCTGKLYIKGTFNELLPLLLLGSEIHAGTKISNSYGYYILHTDSPRYFDMRILNKGALVSVIQDVFDRYDMAELLNKECNPYTDSNVGSIKDEEELATELLNELTTGDYKPSPNKAFKIKKKNGGERLIEQLPLRDLIVSQLLLKFLSEPFDRILEESAIGFRKGISRQRAIEIFRKAVNDGYHYVIESDIEEFFPSVNHEILKLLLDHYIPSKDIVTKETLKKLISTGYTESGKLYERHKGLAQGSPLSPLLANLYLDTFDEQMALMNLRLIRYADDFIILARTKEEAQEALTKTESFLSDLGLRIKKEKTAIRCVFDGFEFLGIRFDKGEVASITGEEVKTFRKPLFITEPYVFISISGDTINIKKDGNTIESLPLRRISKIILMGNAAFSSSLIKRCTELNIPLTMTLGSGYFITTIKAEAKGYFDISYLHSKKYYELSDAMRFEIARDIVSAKIENYITLFKGKRLPLSHPVFNTLERAISALQRATGINELRGIEGMTARKVLSGINELIENPAFHIRQRKREKPDRINSLLNLSHYLVFSRINAIVRSAGLNPYLGFLHEPENRYESLVADLQEPFRARIEGILIKALNLNIIKEGDFTESERGAYLKKDTLKRFLNYFEAELERSPRKSIPSLKDHMYLQVLKLKEFMLDRGEFSLYRWKE